MKDFVEKDASTTRKRNYHWHEFLKNEEKMISTSQHIRFPLARMSSFFQNRFLLIPMMVSTSSEIALIKKYCFHWAENPFALAGWKKKKKNTFPLYVKAASILKNLWKVEKIGVRWQGYGSSLNNWLSPNFNNSFHLQKKTQSKTIYKKQVKNLVSTFPIFSS